MRTLLRLRPTTTATAAWPRCACWPCTRVVHAVMDSACWSTVLAYAGLAMGNCFFDRAWDLSQLAWRWSGHFSQLLATAHLALVIKQSTLIPATCRAQFCWCTQQTAHFCCGACGRELGHFTLVHATSSPACTVAVNTAHNLLLPHTAHFCWLVAAHLVLATARWVATASHRPMLPGHGPLNMFRQQRCFIKGFISVYARNKKRARTFINRIVG